MFPIPPQRLRLLLPPPSQLLSFAEPRSIMADRTGAGASVARFFDSADPWTLASPDIIIGFPLDMVNFSFFQGPALCLATGIRWGERGG